MVNLTDPFPIAILAYLIITVAVGGLTFKLIKKSSKRFIVAGKSLPLFLVATMLSAQAVDGNSTLGNAGLVYEFGFWAGAVIPLGLGLCLLFVGAVFGKVLNRMNMLTLPDFYFRRYGNVTESFSGILMMISFTILVAGNLAAAGFLLSVVFDIDYTWGIIISALLVLAYTFLGGLFASAYTNVFQVYLAVGGLWAAMFFFMSPASPVPFDTMLGNAPEGFMDLSGLYDPAAGAYLNWAGLLALAIGDVIALDFMERVFATKDGKTASRGAYLGGIITLVTVVPSSMLGIFAITLLPNVEDPFTVVPVLAIEHMPFAIGAALLMGIVGASMSTASGGMLAVSTVMSRNLLQRNILRKLLKRPGLSDKKLLWVTRAFTIPMMIAGLLLGYFVPQPGVFLILAFDVVFAGAFVPLLMGIFWKKANASAAIASLAVGSALRLLLFVMIPEELAGLDTMIPPVISFGVFVGVALATQNKWIPRHAVISYIPADELVVEGRELDGFDPTGKAGGVTDGEPKTRT